MKVELSNDVQNALNNFSVPEQVGFGQTLLPIMITSQYEDGKWSPLEISPYADLRIDPSMKVLHYAQEIFEGLKGYISEDDQALLFRPDQNAKRFNHSAGRMAMPNLPEEMFLEAVKEITKLGKPFIPREEGSSLYIRPFMFASEVGLGIKPAEKFIFMVIASPSGPYFNTGNLNVLIEREAVRAVSGGVGTAKTGGNYAASLLSAKKSKEFGCQQTIWLDAIKRENIEEMSGMNFMAVINNKLVTPSLTDTILAGITRSSLLDLAKEMGVETIEKTLTISELIESIKKGECTEAFACGTAAVVTPIALFKETTGEQFELSEPNGNLGQKLKARLLHIQNAKEEGPQGWSIKID